MLKRRSRWILGVAIAVPWGAAAPSLGIIDSTTSLYMNDAIGASVFYNAGYTGSRARIANIEAGYAWNGHETLSPLGTGLRYFSDPTLNATTPSWWDWHATAVSQTMVGRGTTNRQRGIAYGASLWSGAIATSWNTGTNAFQTSFNLPVSATGNANFFGPYYAASVGGVSNTTTGTSTNYGTADVINSSWGTAGLGTTAKGFYNFTLDALTFASGKPFVFAAGNDGPATNTLTNQPSSINVFTVAALKGASTAPYYDTVPTYSSRGPVDFFLTTSTNGSTGTTLTGVRAKVEIAAPGDNLTLAAYGGKTGGNAGATGGNVFSSTNTYFNSLSGTSLAAPVVAGSLALLVDVAKDRFAGSAASVDGRTLKAVLMNSASKITGWTNNTSLQGGVYRTTQGLDYATGAGRLNLATAFSQFTAGVTDLPGTAGATVSSLGWDAGAVASNASSITDYPFNYCLLRNTTFTATLSWYARGVYGISPNYTARYGSFYNLDLQLYRVDPDGNTLVAESASLYNSSEHLYFTLPTSGQYFIRVRNAGALWQFGSDSSIPYGLAWSSTTIDQATATACVWDAPGNAPSSVGANWVSGRIPSTAGAVAIFPSLNSSPATVAVTASAVMGTLRLDSSASYTLSGAGGSLLFDSGSAAPASLIVVAGSHTLSAPATFSSSLTATVPAASTLTFTGGISGPGALNKTGSGALLIGGSLSFSGGIAVTAGTLTVNQRLQAPTGPISVANAGTVVVLSPPSIPLAAGTVIPSAEFTSISVTSSGSLRLQPVNRRASLPNVVVTSSLSIATGGELDLGNGDLVIRGGRDGLEAIRSLLSNGALKASAASPGSANYLPFTTLALCVNDSSLSGTATIAPYFPAYPGAGQLGTSDVIIKYTYVGDTNLDGILDGRDYKSVIEGYATAQTGWNWGDTDNSGGLITTSDVNAFLTAYNYYLTNPQPNLGAGSSTSISSQPIPEPVAAPILLVTASSMATRRPRRGRSFASFRSTTRDKSSRLSSGEF